METSGGSFIPQRPQKGKVAAKSLRKVYVLSYVSYLVFFATLMAVGGIFIYKLSLTSNLTSLQEQLVEERNAFNHSELQRIQNLDLRIDTAAQLVNQHASLLTIFRALENTVADPVALRSFDYSRVKDLQNPTVTLAATAEDFDTVLFQQQVLANNETTSGVSISSIALTHSEDETGQPDRNSESVVELEFVTEIGAGAINYRGTSQSFREVQRSVTIPLTNTGAQAVDATEETVTDEEEETVTDDNSNI